MAKIYGISRFVNKKNTSVQRTVKILPKTGTRIIKFTNNGELMSKVVIPGSGNSSSREIENIVTNYKDQRPSRINVRCKENYNFMYHGLFKNLQNGWRIFENLNVWTAEFKPKSICEYMLMLRI